MPYVTPEQLSTARTFIDSLEDDETDLAGYKQGWDDAVTTALYELGKHYDELVALHEAEGGQAVLDAIAERARILRP